MSSTGRTPVVETCLTLLLILNEWIRVGVTLLKSIVGDSLFQSDADIEDASSLPLMALACGVAKGKNPRRIIFSDKPVVELRVMDDSCFTRQTLPTGFFPCTQTRRQIVVDAKYISQSDHALAVARSKALDLLSAWVVGDQELLP